MKNHAIIVGADDWEGLFVNGMLVDEGHTLNDGMSRKKYLSKICKEYDLELDEILEGYVTDEYEELLNDVGSFHQKLADVDFYLNDEKMTNSAEN